MTSKSASESSGILLAGPMMLPQSWSFPQHKGRSPRRDSPAYLQIAVCQPCHESCFLQLSFFLKTETLDILQWGWGKVSIFFFPISQSVALCASWGVWGTRWVMAARTGKQGWKALESFPGKQHLESHRGKAAVICITQGGTPLGCILAGVVPWAAACPPPVPFQEQTAPCIPDKENGFT